MAQWTEDNIKPPKASTLLIFKFQYNTEVCGAGQASLTERSLHVITSQRLEKSSFLSTFRPQNDDNKLGKEMKTAALFNMGSHLPSKLVIYFQCSANAEHKLSKCIEPELKTEQTKNGYCFTAGSSIPANNSAF